MKPQHNTVVAFSHRSRSRAIAFERKKPSTKREHGACALCGCPDPVASVHGRTTLRGPSRQPASQPTSHPTTMHTCVFSQLLLRAYMAVRQQDQQRQRVCESRYIARLHLPLASPGLDWLVGWLTCVGSRSSACTSTRSSDDVRVLTSLLAAFRCVATRSRFLSRVGPCGCAWVSEGGSECECECE